MHGNVGEEPSSSETKANGMVVDASEACAFTHLVRIDTLIINDQYFLTAHENENDEEVLLSVIDLKDKNKLKKLIRSHHWSVDHGIRKTLWLNICRHLHKGGNSDVYDDVCQEMFGLRTPDELPMPPILNPNIDLSYHLDDIGKRCCSKVITVATHMNPDVTYSPTLAPIVSLMLHYMEPSDCFNCLYGLLRTVKDNYVTQTKVALEASKLVLKDLAKKHTKSAYSLMTHQSGGSDSMFDNWLWWIYRDLPFSYIVRITDCFLLEGIKVLYRMALAILSTYSKYSLRSGATIREGNNSNLAVNIPQFCEDIPVGIDKLMKTAFGIKGLTKKKIRKLQLKHEMYLKSCSHSMTMSKSFSGPIILQQNASSALSLDMFQKLWSWLPPRFVVCQPELLYTSEEHGISLKTLYSRVEAYDTTLLIVKTTSNETFGAFCSRPWSDRKHNSKSVSYFGTGETFIFKLHPTKVKYEWVGQTDSSNISHSSNMFMAGDNTVLTVGGGNGEAIRLDESFTHCTTKRCDTFNNDPLCSNTDFSCKVVEVFAFL